jgi:alpha-tubulin suppressor-like RCC1 family protein
MKWFHFWFCVALSSSFFCVPPRLSAQVATNSLSGRVIVKLLPDYLRPVVYALNESTGTNAGTLLALNASSGSTIAEITVGTNPTDMTIAPGGDALYVINTGSRTISKVNLDTFSVVAEKAISTPYAANPSYPLHVAAGRSNLVYFTDGALRPRITTFDYENGTNVGVYSAPVGGMVLTHDCNTMYTFYQYGWGTGGDDGTDYFSYIQRVDTVTNDLTGLETGPFQGFGPLDAPILIDATETRVFNKVQMVSATDVSALLTQFSDNIYAISADGSLAFGPTEVFSSDNGNQLTNFPFSATVQVLSGDQRSLFRYQPSTSNLLIYDMSAVAPVSEPSIVPTPANGAVINLPLANVVWTFSPYALNYDVYFGTNQFDIANATPASSQYLGRVGSPMELLPQPLSSGTIYYWRVDGIGLSVTNAGSIWSFATSPLTVSQQNLTSAGIAGMPVLPQQIAFTASLPAAWNLAIGQSWLSASATNGTTPSSVTLSFNTTNLISGFYTNQIILTANGISLQLSLVLQLYDLNPLKIVADPNRDYIYVLHPGSGINADAFLLFLNTDTGIVERVIPIGINPTDMSINRFEDRLYVSNWQNDQTHVVDLKTGTELPPLFLGTDVYKLSGSFAGQIVTEGEDQWITASLINTTNGAIIATAGLREGDGECDPSGRYYYHVDNDDTGAGIAKYDIGNNSFIGITNAGQHYPAGSRNLVMSMDGSRLFWTSAMYDSNLVDFGVIGAEIYSCSTNGSIAFSDTQAYDTAAKQAIYSLPVASTVEAVDRLDQKLWYFNSSDGDIESISMELIKTPSIIQQPATSTIVTAGTDVNLTVTANGLNPLFYQWYFGNTSIIGSTNYVLTLTNIQFLQSGNYEVIVSNCFGVVTSTVAQVMVLSPPYITNQPSIISVFAGSNATMTVGALGTAPMSYQWSFGGTAIVNATNSTLTVSNAQSSDEGYYQVTLANDVGTTTSLPIILRVLPSKALIVSGPVPVSVPAGSQAVFNASVIGSAPLTFQWYKDDVLLPGANSFQLVISNAQAADAGMYQLLVSNVLGTAVSTGATLAVLPAKPSFVLQPVSVAAVAGNSMAFESLATGTDDGLNPIKYAWYFQNKRISGQSNPDLFLASIAATNQGAYYAVAANTYGAATSEVVQLTVYLPPTLQIGLSNQVVDEGKTIVLNPGATGTPPLAYSWNFNTTQLTNTDASLYLTNITPLQSGFYSVIVTNQYGSVSSTGRISVFSPASSVMAWGDDSGGQTDVPASLDDAVAIAGGDYHSVAIRHDGTLVAWGFDDEGQIDVPTNSLPFVSVAAGADHNLAIAGDGSVVAWGLDDSGQTDVPGTVSSALSVAAGDSHSLALLSSGTVVAWGNDTYGQTDIPLQLFPGYWVNNWWWGWVWVNNLNWMPVEAIAAGRNHSLALLTNGTVVAWGDNSFGQASPPSNLSNVVGITAGYLHSAALCSNGTVVVWGDDTFGQTNVPTGLSNVVAIAAGDFHTFALCSNGRIVAWGDNTFGQMNVPSSVTNVVGIASGYYHGLALAPFIQLLQLQLTRNGLVLNWNGTGVLQWAPAPTGPYTDVPFQGNSWTNLDMSAPAKFFRVRR